MMLANLVAALAFAIWIYLLLGHGGFWRSAEGDEGQDAPLVGKDTWPAVTVVIPARDEAECIGETVASLLRQDYPAVRALCWSTTRPATAPPRWRNGPPCRAYGGPAPCSGRPPAAAAMDGQALGAEAGDRDRPAGQSAA